MTAGIKSVIGT